MSGPTEADRILDHYRAATTADPAEAQARLADLHARLERGEGQAEGGDGDGATRASRPLRVLGPVLLAVVGVAAWAGSRGAARPEPVTPASAATAPPSVPPAPTVAAETPAPAAAEPEAAAPDVAPKHALAPEVASGSAARARPRSARRGARRRAARPPEGPSPLNEEVALLARARRALGRGDAGAALAALAEHARRFPEGQLVRERERSKVTALCVAGRPAEAKAYARRKGAPFTGCDRFSGTAQAAAAKGE